MSPKKNYLSSVTQAWKNAWKFKSFRIQSIITLVIVLSFTVIFNWFFDFVESRKGAHLEDFLLMWLPAYNVSWIVFFFLYCGIIFGIYFHLDHPKTILIAFQTYVIVTFVRIFTITFLPLEPPSGYIPLREPFVQLFTNGGKIISKDLFFSGHMSTILSLFFSSHKKFTRAFLLLCSLMVGTMVLVQHVHYTIDVIVAIPATYLIYFFSKRYLGGRAY
jgi:hypothetical protein